MITKEKLIEEIQGIKCRSRWAAAVREDAACLVLDLPQGVVEAVSLANGSGRDLFTALLNGAKDWRAYSWDGCALIYDGDIARHYCTPSELKKTKNGQRRPNSREEWLDVQARALFQASMLIARCFGDLQRAEK